MAARAARQPRRETDESIRERSDEMNTMLERMDLPLALMGGTRAMQDAGTKYLPQEPRESNDAYDVRLANSTLFNVYRRTVINLVSKPFKEPVKFDVELPEAYQTWADNIDMTGRSLSLFLNAVLTDAINCGLSHILVELPNVPPMNAAEERAVGLRPYWVHVRGDAILGWRSEISGGKQRLTQVRILETVKEPSGEWGVAQIEQVRVLYAADAENATARWEEWRPIQETRNQKTVWVLSRAGVYTTTTEIPLVTAYTNRTEFMMAEPPLTDLADVNVEHYRSGSDQRHILHVARVPILFATGLGETDAEGNQPFEVSPNSLTRGEEGADLKYVEHSGAAIGAGRQDLEDLENRMGALGAEAVTMMRFGPRGTATEVAETSSEVDASTGGWVEQLQVAAQEAWDLSFAMMRQTPVGQLSINTEWSPFMSDPQGVTNLLKLNAAGIISKETTLREAIRLGAVSAEIDVEAELEAAENELPEPMPTTPPGSTGFGAQGGGASSGGGTT